MENNTGINLQSNQESATSFLENIRLSDKKLLQGAIQRVRPTSQNYEDSWGYIIQATRYGGFKWYDPHTESLIFFGRKSDMDPTLVIPNFFAQPKYLRDVIIFINNASHVPQTILKNVSDEDITKLIPYGFRQYRDDEGWSKNARFDDQTYPQSVAALKKIAERKGSGYNNLRTALNKKPNLIIRKYRKSDKDRVLKLFAFRDNNLTDSKERLKRKYFSSHAMYPTAAVEKFVIIDTKTDELVGFTATSEISSKTIALVASIFNPYYKPASVWGIYQTLMIQFHRGYQNVNFGGSARPGTYNFKRRTFRPTVQLKKTHLVYKI